MAIKGKSKSRSTRAVTRGPKPVYQPIRRPVFARRGLWLVVAGVFGTLLVGALVIGFVLQRNADRQDALERRMRTVLSQYQGDIDPILAAIGQPQPPAGYAVFTELTQAVVTLESETKEEPADARALKATARDAIASARTALTALDQIDEATLVRGKGFSEAFVLYVINSKRSFIHAISLYRETARLVDQASGVTGPEREAFAGSARRVLDVATDVFARGYGDYVEAQTQAGTFQPTSPALPGTTGS